MIYDYEYFKKEIYSLTTIDLNAYKEKQMKRRIDTLIAKHKIVGYDKYVQALKTDKVLFEEFVGYITINVSEFYRNPEQWKYLEETVIPELIQRFGKNLKVWSAACSTGDEPYSLVMALSRHIPLQQIRIYATDLDKQVIAKAKTGLYGEKSIEGVPEDLKKPELTAAWELRLSEIAGGRLKRRIFMKDIREYAGSLIQEIRTEEGTFRHDNLTNKKCPRCGKRLLAVNGKNSRLLVCQDRECGYRETVSRTTNARCPVCHKRMELAGKGRNCRIHLLLRS